MIMRASVSSGGCLAVRRFGWFRAFGCCTPGQRTPAAHPGQAQPNRRNAKPDADLFKRRFVSAQILPGADFFKRRFFQAQIFSSAWGI
jgi:hypothetical protein